MVIGKVDERLCKEFKAARDDVLKSSFRLDTERSRDRYYHTLFKYLRFCFEYEVFEGRDIACRRSLVGLIGRKLRPEETMALTCRGVYQFANVGRLTKETEDKLLAVFCPETEERLKKAIADKKTKDIEDYKKVLGAFCRIDVHIAETDTPVKGPPGPIRRGNIWRGWRGPWRQPMYNS